MLDRLLPLAVAASFIVSPAMAEWSQEFDGTFQVLTFDDSLKVVCGLPSSPIMPDLFLLTVTLGEQLISPPQTREVEILSDGATVISFVSDVGDSGTLSSELDRSFLTKFVSGLAETLEAVTIRVLPREGSPELRAELNATGVKDVVEAFGLGCDGGTGKWVVGVVPPDLVVIRLPANERGADPNSNSGLFTCLSNSTSASFVTDRPMNSTVRVRIDDGKTKTLEWQLGTVMDGLPYVGPGSGGPSIKFLKSLLGAERMLLEVQPQVGGDPVVLHFDLTNSEAALKPLSEACGW